MITVFNIYVTDEEIIKRMSGRRVCPNCGASYHIDLSILQREGICDACNTTVIQREDDTEETVLKRLKTYHNQTEPLIEYYKNEGKLTGCRRSRKIEETTSRMFKGFGI